MSELKKKRAEQVQNALDTTLSGIQDDPWLAQHVIHGIQKRKKDSHGKNRIGSNKSAGIFGY